MPSRLCRRTAPNHSIKRTSLRQAGGCRLCQTLALDSQAMRTAKMEPTRTLRFAGAIVAFVIYASALVALLVTLEVAGTAQKTILFVGKAFTFAGLGALVIGWKWPEAVLLPFKRLLSAASGITRLPTLEGSASSPTRGGLHTFLNSVVQRALFALGCLGLVPWLLIRVVRELWRSSGTADYMRSVFIEPLSPWFESGWWWYTKLQWYDWPVLPSLVGLGLAFTWPYTAARLVAWVRGTK